MTEGTTDNTPRIVKMSMCVPPEKLDNNTMLLATFNLFMWPIHVENLRLVRRKGEMRIWYPSKDMRILSNAQPIVIEAAMETARQAMDDIAEMDW